VTNPPDRESRRVKRPSGAMAPIDQDEIEKQLALKDVMEHAVRQTRAVAAAKPMKSYRWRPIVLGALAISSVLFATFAIVVRPAFIYGADPSAVPAIRRDAYARFAMYLLMQRVLEYRAGNGRYPETLEQMGESWQGISFRMVNDSVFELRADSSLAGAPLVLRSDQRVDPFIGRGVSLIRRRRQ